MAGTKAATAAKADSFEMKKAGELAALTAFTLLVLERDAHAYLEPGTFNFFIQTLLGAALGAAIYIKLSWRRIKVAVRRWLPSKAEEEER